MTLDYFYGQAGELFSFYRIPKALFQEPRFQSLSTDAKTLYGILLDRMSLSAKNGWLDEQGRVFIMKNRKKACPATKSGPPPATSSRSSRTMNFDYEELMLMMLYNTGTRLGLIHELRLMQCYLMPDETALRELSEGVIEKLKLLTDAEFAELEFPLD